ncbi:DUF2721 domain-containing protein [Algoriphagus boritolerans]|uniref:DUF2721 domain-containing protein n=1 Tax=Algoriphagus boritolerans DSM 17298 = JCM 18970 TaxID=1120964 RepID=A0A1H5ZBX7_9BACT|nr:DUF2721 domain-containing protein [Algoriphagus boritolerans]SEG33540.1 Protein of unknown function [Algoriphagus boritolerans DSM 17298 = JCM 18970]
MELQLSTPALLFSAITLLMLAFTNRFLAIATLIRSLHKNYLKEPDSELIVEQIQNLRSRLTLIKNMQLFGVFSFLLCIICMYLLFQGYTQAANWVFVASMLSLLISLAISLIEIQISTKALNLELSDMEEIFENRKGSLDIFFKKDPENENE